MSFRTALYDVLGIDYPIMQSGMGSVAGPELVAEVSRAGGLGIIAGLNIPLDELRRRIRYVREHTDRPFGVNLWLHTELRPPVDVNTIPAATIARVQETLNEFRRRLEIPEKSGRPGAAPNLVDPAIDVLIGERVPVFSTGIGLPDAGLVRRCHAAGVKVVAMVATVDDARESLAGEFWKKRLLESDAVATTVTDAFTGQWARTLVNTLSREYRAAGAPVLPSLIQSLAARDVYDAAAKRQDGEYFPMYSGHSVGLIHNLPGAAEVVEQIIREARAVLADLARRLARSTLI